MSSIDPRTFYGNPPQGKPFYVRFVVPPELAEKAYEVLSLAKQSGKIKKGSNEATKMIERGMARLVLIAEDVDPPEIVAHLPLLCEERGVPYIYVPSKEKLGKSAGIEATAAAAVIIEPGQASQQLDDLITQLNDVRAKAGLNPVQPQQRQEEQPRRQRR